MQAKLGEYNSHREKSGYRPIAVGIGVNAGSLMLGTVGEHERMDGSVISDAVNLSSRLQSLTRIYGASVLTTGQTLKKLKNPGRFHCRFIDRIRVRGRKETVLLFGPPLPVRSGSISARISRERSVSCWSWPSRILTTRCFASTENAANS
jgi:class 3 adenylate cyclase